MTEKFKFIQGSFSPPEAADLLLSLVNYKIKFHSLKCLNIQNDEKNVHNSEIRLAELGNFKQVVERMVIDAHQNNMDVRIKGNIEVELVDPDRNNLNINSSKE
ncbi:hypothetical protein ACW6QP_05375 [Salegentibacter sp. HM20]